MHPRDTFKNTTLFQVGERVVGLEGERGVITEVGIAMRDSRDQCVEAVKLDLDPTPRWPTGVKGAYRYVRTIKRETANRPPFGIDTDDYQPTI